MIISKIAKQILILLAALIIEAAVLLTCHPSPTPLHGSSEQVDTLEWVNGGGDIVSSIKADPSYFEEHDKYLIDSMAKVYKTKPNRIIEYVTIHTEGKSDIPQSGPTAADYFPVDTTKDCPPQIKSLTADFVSPYDSLHVVIAAPGSADTSSMHKVSKDTLTMVGKWVKEGNIFNRHKNLQFDFSNANPDNRIYIDKIYRPTEKPKKWGIGGQVGRGFSNSMKAFTYFGIGISYNPIRF